jgi:hypothetical protein
VTPEEAALAAAVRALEDAGVPYMITGESERQLADAAGIAAVAGATLDRKYVEQWAEHLAVLDLWRRIAPAP